MLLILLLEIFSTCFYFSIAERIFDNAIIGQPYISCERDRIVVEVITERLFTGKMFVKGDYANPACIRSFRNGAVVRNIADPIFMGTVKKSPEENPDHEGRVANTYYKTSDGLERNRNKKMGFDSKSGNNQESELRVNDSNVRNYGNSKVNGPLETENFLINGANQNLKDSSHWKGIGGATTGFGAAFGGSRGEEKLTIFEKAAATVAPPESIEQRVREKYTDQTESCEPCVCEEKRSRRATNSIRIEVPLNSCNSKRDRKLNPPSVVVSFVAIISFHDSFITKLDKAYHIQCAYSEAEKTVSTDIDVNQNEETELTITTEAPTCEYLISDVNGRPVRNSLVGNLIKHEWICRGGLAHKLRMLVHDCSVKDGSGEQFQIIDEHGCTLDQLMLQTPTYSENGLSAHVEAFTFKFPDRTTVDFRCSITFCSIDDNECQHVSPPNCNSNYLPRKKRSSHMMISMSLHSNTLSVFDVDSENPNQDFPQLPKPESLLSIDQSPSSFCISVASFGILISASTFFATLSFAILFSYIFIRFNHKFLTY